MTTLYRILKFGFQGFWRNFVLSFNATFIMTLTLVTLSIFFVLNVVVTRSTDKLESRLDMTIFITEQSKPEEITDFIKLLRLKPEVREVLLIDKGELLAEWRELYKNDAEFRDLINENDNPLLREVRVKAQDPAQLEMIASYVEGRQFETIVSDLSYRENQQRIINFINLSKLLRKVSLIISFVFAAIAIFVIFTTVRLTIYSRREEIEIMRLVGATSILVRYPFILEGVLYGILATACAELLTLGAIWGVKPLEAQYLGSSGGNLIFGSGNQSFLSLYQDHITTIIIVHLVCGILIGVVSSYIAVKKYLK